MFDHDLFGAPVINGHKSVLAQTFEYPPFSVLNAREGWWQERKRQWLALGIESELGRGGGADDGMMAFDNRGGLQSWQARHRAGAPALPAIIETSNAAPGGSARPACDYRNKQRGDGRGRPM